MIPGLLPILLHSCKIKSGLGTRLQYNTPSPLLSPPTHTHTHLVLIHLCSVMNWYSPQQSTWTTGLNKGAQSSFSHYTYNVYWLHCTTSSARTKVLNNNWGKPCTASDISWAGSGNKVTLNMHKQLIREHPSLNKGNFTGDCYAELPTAQEWPGDGDSNLYASLGLLPVLHHSYCHLQYK